MMRWKNIVAVVTNPLGREQLAATKAARIAARCGARLTLFNAFMVPQPAPPTGPTTSEQVIAAAVKQRRAQLSQIAAKVRDVGGPRIRFAVEWDFPAHEAIVRHVLETKPDLVVAESHRQGRLARMVLANTDWELIRACPAPVWFARSGALPRSPRVLVAVDPRHTHAKPARLDDRLLAAANDLVGQLGGRVDLVHAYESPGRASRRFLQSPREAAAAQYARQIAEEAARAVDRLGERHGVDASRRFMEEGRTVEVLPSVAARRKVDVLVMGAVSRSLLERPVIGATAERVIDHVECDVFIVKPAGFKTPVKRGRPHL